MAIKKSNESEEIIVMQTLLTTYLMVEQLDDLATTQCFKHTLKKKANILLKELEDHVDRGLSAALEVDTNLTYALIEQRKKILKLYAIMSEEEINMIAEFMNAIIQGRIKKVEKDVQSIIENHQQV